MDFDAFRISASGMAAEKLRLDVTAANLANMHTSAPDGTPAYRPSRVVTQAVPLQFSRQFADAFAVAGGGTRVVGIEATNAPPRMEYDPAHPHANAQGFVAYPGVNHAMEMVNMTNALRAYEANVVAMNAAKTMAARALEIGGQ